MNTPHDRSTFDGLRIVLAFVTLLISLTVVVWRQGRTHAVLRELDTLRRDHAAARAEHASFLRTLQQLESRGSIVEEAERRLHMRVPGGHEILLAPDPAR